MFGNCGVNRMDRVRGGAQVDRLSQFREEQLLNLLKIRSRYGSVEFGTRLVQGRLRAFCCDANCLFSVRVRSKKCGVLLHQRQVREYDSMFESCESGYIDIN